MFGTPLTPIDSLAPKQSNSRKASAAVPEGWKPQVIILETLQSTSRTIPFSAYLVSALSGEKFNNENYTLTVAIPVTTWSHWTSTWFPMLDKVPIAKLYETLKDAPFKIPIQAFSEDMVQVNVKIHQSLLQEVFPEGVTNTELTAVQLVMVFFVYTSSAKIATPGVSFKVGYINKL